MTNTFNRNDGTFAAIAGTDVTGVISNTRLSKSANYTVDATDSGKLIALGGSAFFTLTLTTASGYSSTFAIRATNEDSGRGKTIAPNGLTSFILWPGQSCDIFNDNNTWVVHPPLQRWRHAGGTLNVYCDFTNGADTNDGLTTGSGNAFKTVQQALDFAGTYLDFRGTASSPTRVIINMANSTTDTTGVHYSGHSFTGAQGGAAVKIVGAGAGSVISTTSADALGFFCNAQVQLKDLKLQTSTSGNCITAQLGSQVELVSGITFGTCAGNHFDVSTGGKVLIDAGYTVSGNATYHWLVQDGGSYIKNQGGSITVTVSASLTPTGWVLTSNMGCVIAPSITYSLGANTVTGKRYEADNLALITTNGGGANYFPGNAAGSTSGGGQYI